MSMIDEIDRLPTYATQEIVIQWFKRVIDAYDAGAIKKTEMFDCLSELADQQWHQYKLMPEELSSEIEEWAVAILDVHDENEAELLVVLAHSLAFRRKTVQALAAKVGSKRVRDEIEEMLEGKSGIRIDPYSSLRKE